MIQKQVKIIGLTVNRQFGILEATSLKFDKNNRIIAIKGEAGVGKTTAMRALQLGTQGAKTLTDKNLYGEIDTEVQLLDGEMPVFIGCRSNKDGALVYTLYTKDTDGKTVKNPIIDGVKATPAKYLELLQTELTWNLDKLTSENPKVQRDILLKLYRRELIKSGVIFDKNNPKYPASILGRLDKAIAKRDEMDYLRKQNGGIRDDLLKIGINPDVPETIPARVDIEAINTAIAAKERAKTVKEVKAKESREKELLNIKLKAADVKEKINEYNKRKRREFELAEERYKKNKEKIDNHFAAITKLREALQVLGLESKYTELTRGLKPPEKIDEPEQPVYIDDRKSDELKLLDKEAAGLVEALQNLRALYKETEEKQDTPPDLSSLNAEIEKLKEAKEKGQASNKLREAVESFENWREANEDVMSLKQEYLKILAGVNTGVKGLIIQAEGDNIFLTYDGAYDPEYFYNKEAEPRKVSAYSGTQKAVIALLVQSYLLEGKPKAMRYLYIDNVPIDKKTRKLLEDIALDLNVTIFLNMTGDFKVNELRPGEILISGGEVFFKQ